MANEPEAAFWLKADVVLLVEETLNDDGTTTLKLRQSALLETPDKIESIVVTFVQTQVE